MNDVGFVSTISPTRACGTVNGGYGVLATSATGEPCRSQVRRRSLSAAISPPSPGTGCDRNHGRQGECRRFGEWIERPASGDEGKHVDALVPVQPMITNEALKLRAALGQAASGNLRWHVQIHAFGGDRRGDRPDRLFALEPIADPRQHEHRLGRRLLKRRGADDHPRARGARRAGDENRETNRGCDHATTIADGRSRCSEGGVN